jgi:hypothetical protein
MAASPATAGYPFIGGRADDTIIRGGENIAPAEIEEVLVEYDDVRVEHDDVRVEHDDVRVEHDDVRACAVVGAEDPQWGQKASCPTRSGRRGSFGAVLIGACLPRCVHCRGAELSRPAVSLRCGWR